MGLVKNPKHWLFEKTVVAVALLVVAVELLASVALLQGDVLMFGHGKLALVLGPYQLAHSPKSL